MSAELQEQNRGAGPSPSSLLPATPGRLSRGLWTPIQELASPVSACHSHQSAPGAQHTPAGYVHARESDRQPPNKQTAGTGTQGGRAGESANAPGHSALCRACGSVPSRPRAAPRDEWALTTEHFWSKTEQSPPLHAPVAKITPASACGVAENIRGAFRPRGPFFLSFPLPPPLPACCQLSANICTLAEADSLIHTPEG